MSSSSNTGKNIVLRNRTIVVIKKNLETSEKKEILMKLIKEAEGHDRVNKAKKVFDFFVKECVDDFYFRRPKLLAVIKEKLNDGASSESFGWELSSKYMRAIFPRSARIEYLLLRAKSDQIQYVKKKNECSYVKWVCCYSPMRTFRNVMDFIGSDYHHKL
jgi:hypothetical protein